MQKFKYKVTGSNKDKFIFAENKKHAANLLKRQGVEYKDLIAVQTKTKTDFKKFNKKLTLPFLKRILQLHRAGLPIGDTLKILQARLTDPIQKELALGLWRELSEGKSFGESLKRYPQVFGEDIIYPIEAAEITGNLAPILKEIIYLLEEREALKKKIFNGMAYPMIVSIVSIFVVGLFLFFLLPKIEHMLKSLGGQLSLPAQLLIIFSHGLLYGLPVVIGLGIVTYTILYNLRKRSAEFKLKSDTFLLKCPVIKTLLRNIEICRVTNLLSTLLSSGVNLTEAMRLTERVIHNAYFRQVFQEARSKINDGVAMSVAFKMKKIPFFTELALDILSVGENTGNMQDSLKEIYQLHNTELDGRFQFLTSFITSAALGFAFFLVGILAIGIISSVMQFSSSIKI